MNILLSFLQDKGGPAHQVPAYRFWLHYLKNGIGEAGMNCLEVPDADWAEGLMYTNNAAKLNQWNDRTWSATLDYVKNSAKKIDLFLCYLYPHQIDESAIRQIQQAGIPCVNFYCDNVRHFNSVPREFKVFDLVWVPEYEALSMYKKAGVNYINLPMPMWVAPELREVVNPIEEPTLSFIGSKDALREQLLSAIIGKGLDVHIQGSGWLGGNEEPALSGQSLPKKVANQFSFVQEHGIKGLINKFLQKFDHAPNTYIPPHLIFKQPGFAEYVSITQNSNIILGINRVPSFKRTLSNPLKYSRLRDIEAPMLGACYLTEHCAGVEQLYDTQNEIYTYTNGDDLVYKANELLNNPSKRNELRLNGRQKALNEYSIPASLDKMKKKLF